MKYLSYIIIIILAAAAGFIVFRLVRGPGDLAKDFDLRSENESELHSDIGTLEQIDMVNSNTINNDQPEILVDQEYIEVGEEIMVTDGIRHLVPLDKVLSGGPAKDGIPSIDSPLFVSVTEADEYLEDEKLGIAVEKNGKWRFYPFQILVWHEIVNDVFEDEPILVTYCPLCGTGIVFDPRIEGERVGFGTSGRLFNSNLVMYDRKTDTLWSQQGGRAIVGKLTGLTLPVRPADNVFWGEFKQAHPEAEVLSRETGIVRDYTRDPYSAYYKNSVLIFPVDNRDDRLHEKTIIYGLNLGGQAKAYPDDIIKQEQIINDKLADMNILAVVEPESQAVRFFNRDFDSQTLSFTVDNGILLDNETGSEWSFNGLAVSGPLLDTALERLNPEFGFWFSWAAFNPATGIYGS